MPPTSSAPILGAISLLFSTIVTFSPAGSITVNTPLDDPPANDETITLREAILIANDQRDVWDDGDPMTLDESHLVTGEVGMGHADTINVAVGNNIISLSPALGVLPPLIDSPDAIMAGSTTPLDGSDLTGTSNVCFTMAGNGFTIRGFTVKGFSGGGVVVTGANNNVGAMFIENCGSHGLVVTGSGATGNTFDNMSLRTNTGNGLVVQDSASMNDFSSIFSYSNTMDGVVFESGATMNTFRASSIGIDDLDARKGNTGYGLILRTGATNNTFGDPASESAFTYISNNTVGGILIEGNGTDANLFHSMFIGVDEADPTWVGNGTGHGIHVRGGAKNNLIGKMGVNTTIAIGGHMGNGILVEDRGTDGTFIERVDIGGKDFFISDGNQLTNEGHGVEVRGGVKNTTIAGPAEFRQADIENTGGNGIFLNGDDAENPIMNTVLGYYHIGDMGSSRPERVIGGDAVHVTGNVDGVVIGGENHSNTTGSAEGWGIVLDGPNVRNIELVRVICGEYGGSPNGNFFGGMVIRNGAHDISFRGGNDFSTRSHFNHNKGPAILINAIDMPLPYNITIRNASIGIGQFGDTTGNTEDGIFVQGAEEEVVEPKGPQGSGIVALTGVKIGTPDTGDHTVISGNDKSGIHMLNVSGVTVQNCRIGTNAEGTSAVANSMDGIRVNKCTNLTIGGDAAELERNLISGNIGSGIRFEGDSYFLKVYRNLIGTNLAGTAAIRNDEAGVIVTNNTAPILEDLIIGGERIPDSSHKGPTLFPLQGNVISGNRIGVLVSGTDAMSSVASAALEGNLIGLNAAGTAAVPNDQEGVAFTGQFVTNCFVGHSVGEEKGNVISGNTFQGIHVTGGANDIAIWYNLIGTNAAGTAAVGNGRDGVRLEDAREIRLGTVGSDANPRYEKNVISGNGEAGIEIAGSGMNIAIAANFIGTNAEGTAAIPNARGIEINRAAGKTFQNVVIGGKNTSLSSEKAGAACPTNVISGNTEDGLKITGATNAAAAGQFRIEGNYIGTGPDGTGTRGNGHNGILVTGQKTESLTIGHETDAQKGNVIAASGKSGIHITGASDTITVAKNIVGVDRTKMTEASNTEHGILVDGNSMTCIIKENTIHSNLMNGVRVSGAMTQKITLTKNSIHKNRMKGIALEEGANAGIQTPVWDKSRAVLEILKLETAANSMVEIFADPTFSEDGYWGQGKDLEREAMSDAMGMLTLDPRTITKNGMLTATITDGMGNTSEFANVWELFAVQTVNYDPPLLVGGKPTAVFVTGDTGKGTARHVLTGTLSFGGTDVATNDQFHIRTLGHYGSDPEGRKRNLQSLHFLIQNPSAGNKTAEVTIREGMKERGKVRDELLNFQTLSGEVRMIAVPFTIPTMDPPNNTDRKTPTNTTIQSTAEIFAALYPVDPRDFLNSRFSIARAFERKRTLGLERRWQRVANRANRIRTNVPNIPGVVTPRYAAAFVSRDIGLTDPILTPNNGVVMGAHYRSLPGIAVVVDLDTSGKPNGVALAHEIGHAPPFSLADTYQGGRDAAGMNLPGVLPDPPARDSSGLKIEQAMQPFDPAGKFADTTCAKPGHACSTQIRDIMGKVVDFQWMHPDMLASLITGLGGSTAAGKGAVPKGEPEILMSPLVVAGTIGTDDTVTMDPFYISPGDTERSVLDWEDVVIADLLDGSDAILDTALFGAIFSVELLTVGGDGEGAIHVPVDVIPYAVLLDNDPAGERVVIRRGETVLAERIRTPNTPTVDVTAPSGPGALPSGTVMVEWTANDLDPGDTENLTYDVIYTPDDGMTYHAVVLDEPGINSLEVETDTLPGGDTVRFIVRASDGWNIGEDASDPPLTATDLAPVAEVTYPEESSELFANVEVALNASAWDAEDGVLGDASLVWTMNGDPTVIATGSGEVLLLPEGVHTLRVTATDSEGQSVFDEVTVTVGPDVVLPADTEWWAISQAAGS